MPDPRYPRPQSPATAVHRPLAPLALVGVLCGILAGAYIYAVNKQQALSNRCEVVQEEIESLKKEIEISRQRIAQTLARENLDQRLHRAGSDLRPIDAEQVVTVDPLRDTDVPAVAAGPSN